MPHPLDRPIRSALTTRHAALAVGGPRACRYRADISPFAAMSDDSAESGSALAGLMDPEMSAFLVGVGGRPVPEGTVERHRTTALQMLGTAIKPASKTFPVLELTDADAPEMLALATLTKPGVYASNSHRFGGYIGIRDNGRLVAMAGQRLQAPGFTEVSAVCTHPDHRGRGYGSFLLLTVAERIRERGETPFLHAYVDNVNAIRLYEMLGFTVRAEVVVQELAIDRHYRGYREGDAGLP
jgi:ribosomal protein S18 acetylase RimI-like enzyme